MKKNCFICSTTKDGFIQAATAALKSSGHRITYPRKVIISALNQITEPLTPLEIFNLALKHGGECSGDTKLDRVTVYRVLQTLEKLGVLHITQNGSYFPCLLPSNPNSEESELNSNQSESFSKLSNGFNLIKGVNNHQTNQHKHFHIVARCSQCPSTFLVDAPSSLVKTLEELLSVKDFYPSHSVIETKGICKQCTNQS